MMSLLRARRSQSVGVPKSGAVAPEFGPFAVTMIAKSPAVGVYAAGHVGVTESVPNAGVDAPM